MLARPELIEHAVATLVGQRVFGLVLGYEDLNDHDELRHDGAAIEAPSVAHLRRSLTRKTHAGQWAS